MPGLECGFLYQRAVLWPATGSFDAAGQPTVGTPVEIAVSWLNKRREVVSPDGTTIALDATADTDRFVPMNSHMWLGTLKAWNVLGSVPDQELMEVKSFNDTSDAKNRHTTRNVGLMRLHNSGAN